MTKGQTEDAERPPSRTGSEASQAAPFTLAKDQAEGAQRTPSRAAAQAGRSVASVNPPYVADAAEEEAERLPTHTVAGAGPSNVPTRPSSQRGAPANVPGPMTTKQERQILNEKVIGYGTFFLKKMKINSFVKIEWISFVCIHFQMPIGWMACRDAGRAGDSRMAQVGPWEHARDHSDGRHNHNRQGPRGQAAIHCEQHCRGACARGATTARQSWDGCFASGPLGERETPLL